jgi:hypothetical protein
MPVCCQECFRDSFLRQFIEAQQQRGNCDHCGAIAVLISESAAVGRFVRSHVERHFEKWDGPQLWSFDLYHNYIPQQSVLKVLRDQLQIFSDRLLAEERGLTEVLLQADREGSKLLDDLIYSSVPSAGQVDFLGQGSLSEIQPRSHGAHQAAWETFKHYAKHFGRYFDHPGTHSREKILKPIAAYFPQVTSVLAPGTQMWRSRVMRSREQPYRWGGWGLAKPDDEVRALIEKDRPNTAVKLGPPPLRLSTNNRMSPAGISYTYLAGDQETCHSEIRPNVGDYVWSGCFETTGPLRIVDLTSIRQARSRSLFSPDFLSDEVHVQPFLQNFASEISAPWPQGTAHWTMCLLRSFASSFGLQISMA